MPLGRLTRAAAVVAAAAMLATGTSACTSSHPSVSWRQSPPSAWDLTLQRIGPDGRVDLPTALSAFVLAVGPVPGAVPVSGRADPIPSGTLAVSWVFARWRELTAAQRAAVLADLGAPAGSDKPAGLVEHPPGPSPSPSRSENPNTSCLSADSAGAQPYRAQVADIATELAAHLGHPFPYTRTLVISLNTVNLEGTSLMYSWRCGVTASGKVTGCVIHVNPRAVSGRYTDAEVRMFLVHEMTHCYLYGRFGTAYDYMPDWYKEGAPTWTMVQLGTSSDKSAGFWQTYLDTQSWELYRRTYSGLGFFVHLAETGTTVWSQIDAIGAAMTGPDNGPIAYTRAGWAAAGVTQRFLDTWGGGYLQGRYPGAAWTSGDPNLPTYRPTLPNAGRLGTGGPLTLSAKEFSPTGESLDIDAPVVTVAPADGTSGRITLGDGRDAGLDATGPYCTLGACTCPPGSPGAGTEFSAMASGQAYISFTGGDKAGSVTLTGQDLQSFCAKAPVDTKPACPSLSAVNATLGTGMSTMTVLMQTDTRVMCNYVLRSAVSTVSATLSIRTGIDHDFFVQSEQALSGTKPVSGIGDEAFSWGLGIRVLGNTAAVYEIVARKGSTFVTVSAPADVGLDRIADLTRKLLN